MAPVSSVDVTAKQVGKVKIAALSTNKYIDVYLVAPSTAVMIWRRDNVYAIAIGLDQIALKVIHFILTCTSM